MTENKLPELPLPHMSKQINAFTQSVMDVEYYTRAQMLELQSKTVEACAATCMSIANRPSNVILGVAVNCADEIRKLK